jgi:hypothetical protein
MVGTGWGTRASGTTVGVDPARRNDAKITMNRVAAEHVRTPARLARRAIIIGQALIGAASTRATPGHESSGVLAIHVRRTTDRLCIGEAGVRNVRGGAR